MLNIFRGWMKMLSPNSSGWYCVSSWWHHQMETFFALLALCVGNFPVTGEFPAQRAVTRRFDVFFDLRLNKRLSKQSWGWWFETPSPTLWRHCKFTYFPVCVSDRNVMQYIVCPWLPSKMAIRCPLYPSIPVMRQCIDTVTASHDPDGGAQGQGYSLHSWLESNGELEWRIFSTIPRGNKLAFYPLQWRHNGRDSVSNHQPLNGLLNRLFRNRSKKTSKLLVTGLCAGNSPRTGEFPAQRASNAEKVSIWWRHHALGSTSI